MNVEVKLPTQYIGLIISDLDACRGQVMSITENSQMNMIGALVPLANMFGYGTKLNALSVGTASFKMAFSHYQAVSPPDGPENFPPAVGMRA